MAATTSPQLPAAPRWRLRILKAVGAISILLNLIAFAALILVIQKRGGLAYIQGRFLQDSEANVDPGYLQRQGLFDALPAPAPRRPVVFAGDSLTAGCEWRELFGNSALILNRGIGGDTSAGLLKRAGRIAALRPLAVFVMIGANDPQLLGYAPSQTVENVRGIAGAVTAGSPDTLVYLQSVLPSRSPAFNRWGEEVSQGIRKLADGRSVHYLDLRSAFVRDGVIRPDLTVDGIHLSASAYLLWKQKIEAAVSEAVRRQDTSVHPQVRSGR